ncbi:2-amino-4-hydroxy-6-hydroxymethyldihydropteridine diphosphokinase [Lysobacter xinjiangensis]|uniref:2-amino-4-hydroxy-6-hydroxymethyldihydropteridine pyrophosphokinase n=1 Tax=Cognatilysobacter xinjiangensis TaxID=546892 RepID=A0ABQ3BYS6_9GAMM|nr:2-amino-4-hydroxy-6-hydroxymethyldihydropteridine diphosphokinase [Lysobacter xinjiangensis]GGZ58964.1 2-amino-4-hydroxy-6-hydroxymethyldihydropteridine diphosphokinase [Lysobacter xinjiangensis]
MSAPVRAYIGLGANLGEAACSVENAIARLAAKAGLALVARSQLYRTPAWGVIEQPDFINAVACVDTTLSANDLLYLLLDIERDAGRDRAAERRWGPRALDLDLLLYGDRRIDAPGLRVPHPHLHERAFVLVPLAEIAPRLVLDGHGPIAALLDRMATGDIEALR